MLPIVAPDQSAAWDRQAEAAGIPLHTLMDAAGRAAAALLPARYPEGARAGVLVAAGLGHNGGDGWVLARALHRVGVPVWVAWLPGAPSPLTAQMARVARADGVREVSPDGPWPRLGVLVDAVLGTGARGAPRTEAAALLERLHDLSLPIVALDGPTGVDLLTGVVHGNPRADLTVTFGALRRGHLLARDEVGDVTVVDIGHPAPADALPHLFTDVDAADALPPLSAREHKGTRGRVVVVGGAPGMSGALRMAARAAFAAGAGLVHAVAPPETVAQLVVAEPDLQTAVQEFDAPLGDEVRALLARADALVVGPGLGRAPGRLALVRALIDAAPRAVIDADALIALAEDRAVLVELARAKPLLVTPHRGEFRALFPEFAAGSELDPWEVAERAAQASGAAVLLKGVPTVIARSGRRTLTVAAGNPGLATGGSGDVLSGIAGAFLARALETELVGTLAAQALGRAGDLAARRYTARAMRPMDVIAALPDLWREWSTLRLVPAAARPPILVDLPRPRTA